MLNYIEYLDRNMGLPSLIATALVALFLVFQITGELLEIKGKVVPEFFKVRKFFHRRKKERAEIQRMIQDVNKLLSEVNAHYSEDNITKRDEWIQWVNDRTKVYDQYIVDVGKNIEDITEALNANTRMTEGIFIQSSRDRILDFATKVSDDNTLVSREEFHRIFKVYDEYEAFLKEQQMSNGEVDIACRIINEAYETRLRNSSFIEDTRGYR